MSDINFKVFKSTAAGEVSEHNSHRPALTGDEVHIGITHSGVCGTEAHYMGADMVLGHEGIGIVKDVGPGVKGLKVGDRVGWGWMQETCGECEYCISGDFFYCLNNPKQFGTHNHDQGSFGSAAVWHEPLLFKIPDSLPSDVAAPLMCAGITVFGPLFRYGLKAGDVVGIVGIGGLGHLALQFANKMGCDVIALSGTEDKREEALKLGAHHFVSTKGAINLEVPRKINLLLVTTSAILDWEQYKSILAPMAQIFPLTVADSQTELKVPFMQFLLNGWRLIGSTGAPKIAYVRMLEFAGLHGIKPMIEPFPMTKKGIEDALKRLNDGKMRYRGVLYAEGV